MIFFFKQALPQGISTIKIRREEAVNLIKK